ncbi:MAG: hypothetical protein LBD10_02335 [Desulfobulbus sp.]|jgi:hypothetical protein|uniref:hypothetical protein n=1 Tax=Desulfobulbus sp. TaxID=895 RepID=UPI00284E1EF4|nr:hypothetical protein [Desulfobulbus sp.]MDR2549033.1 hypothetical protein [Desulfobulbus sp.]
MVKKTVIGLLASLLAVPLAPATGLCWRGGPPPPPRPYYGGYYGGYYGHSHHDSDAWLWGLGGLVLGSVLVAAATQPAPPRQVVYTEPPPPPVNYYSYRPPVSSGTCRWERYVLDGYGRTVFDRYGRPIKEYTTGPCNYPPSW